MVVGKAGQVALVSLMIGIIIFVMAMIFIDPIGDVITETRAADQLDCANTTISDGKKATCLIVDLILPYFIAVILGLAGAYISAKIIG